MLLTEILAALPFPTAETYFTQQPSGVFGVYGDKIVADGSDFDNEVRTHFVTLDLCEPLFNPQPSAHDALQSVLDDNGIPWTKSERMLWQDERLFYATYTFNFTERRPQ